MTYDNSATLTLVSERADEAMDWTLDVMEHLESEFGEVLSEGSDPEGEAARLARLNHILTNEVHPDEDGSAADSLVSYAYDLMCEAVRLQRFACMALKQLDEIYPQCAEIENDKDPEHVGDIISAEGAPQHDFSRFIPVGAQVDSITIKFAESGNPG